MKIIYLELEGFRCFGELNRFEFGQHNEILGDNGQGKSTIMEAIVMGLTGCDKDGVTQGAPRLVTKGKNVISIKLGIQVNGSHYDIERHFTLHKTKTVTNILINRIASTQSQIDEIIGKSSQFLAAFLPGYYCGLNIKDARSELTTLLPLPQENEVLSALAEDEPQAAEALTGTTIIDSTEFVKGEREHLKELEGELKRLEGQEDEIKDSLLIEIPEEIEVDRSELDSVLHAIQSIESAKPILKEVAPLERKRDELLREYQYLQEGLNYDEHIVVCEKCGHENNLNAEQESKNAKIVEKMQDIKSEGKQVAEELQQLKNDNAQMLKQFEETNASALAELRQQANMLQSNLRATEQHNMRVSIAQDNRKRAQERAAKVRDDISKTHRAIERTKERIKAGQLYGSKQCEMQIAHIEKYLTHVKIQLFDITRSTGEIKPTFRLLYDDKEYRVLSTSEKMRCDLEIAKLIRALTKRDYPVFIDNGESITNFEKPAVQTFVARVAYDCPGITVQEGELQHA